MLYTPLYKGYISTQERESEWNSVTLHLLKLISPIVFTNFFFFFIPIRVSAKGWNVYIHKRLLVFCSPCIAYVYVHILDGNGGNANVYLVYWPNMTIYIRTYILSIIIVQVEKRIISLSLSRQPLLRVAINIASRGAGLSPPLALRSAATQRG